MGSRREDAPLRGRGGYDIDAAMAAEGYDGYEVAGERAQRGATPSGRVEGGAHVRLSSGALVGTRGGGAGPSTSSSAGARTYPRGSPLASRGVPLRNPAPVGPAGSSSRRAAPAPAAPQRPPRPEAASVPIGSYVGGYEEDPMERPLRGMGIYPTATDPDADSGDEELSESHLAFVDREWEAFWRSQEEEREEEEFRELWSYERLLELDRNVEQAGGLSTEALGRLRRTAYDPGGGRGGGGSGGAGRGDCSVCLEAFVEGAMLVELPCAHLFHFDCIKPWFKSHRRCPYCRFEVPRGEGEEGGQDVPQLSSEPSEEVVVAGAGVGFE